MANVCSDLGRLPSLLARNVRPRPSYRDVIDADDEYNKMQQLIHNGLVANQPNVQAHIDTWFENYSTIWMTEKDDFIAQYAEANPPLYKFDADIARYDEVANNAEREESIVNVQFLQLESSELKRSIIQHCREWRLKFTQLLYGKCC